MPSIPTTKQKLGDALFRHGVSGALGLWQANQQRIHRRTEKRLANRYDDRQACFIGGEMSDLTHRNYEKALSLLWKAETVAPYLGFHDASKADKVAGRAGTVIGDLKRESGTAEEVRDLVETVKSEDVRREFQQAYSPQQREAICQIMSLLAHGEAYALYTSATLLPLVRGTGAKVGMAMQVMEEAKHFLVLREMLNTIDHVRPLSTAARVLFETIAHKSYYHKLFGMNVVLESFATNLFSHFENYPGLRHIMRPFHMDESRHCAFPQSYAELGNIPDHVTNDIKYQRARGRMLLPAIPLLFDYKPYFEVLGLDAFEFFGRFVVKADRLARRSGFPLPGEPLLLVSVFFNNYVRIFEPHKYDGFKDYTLMRKGEISDEMARRERDVFGDDIFDGISELIAAYKQRGPKVSA
jgi:hypothetical protein